MKVNFCKYHGNGNDFILIDNRSKTLSRNLQKTIKRICDRHFGVGADGVILIQNAVNYDFEMKYYNADGYLGSMCGNGGRCAVAFARRIGIKPRNKKYRLLASDGEHTAQILSDATIMLSMNKVTDIKIINDISFELNTGSPHYIELVDTLDTLNVIELGRNIRHNSRYDALGINVNFMQIKNNKIEVRTYERGVENETLSCGTGVTACAIVSALYMQTITEKNTIQITTLGGDFTVHFNYNGEYFYDIFLQANVGYVYNGEVEF